MPSFTASTSRRTLCIDSWGRTGVACDTSRLPTMARALAVRSRTTPTMTAASHGATTRDSPRIAAVTRDPIPNQATAPAPPKRPKPMPLRRPFCTISTWAKSHLVANQGGQLLGRATDQLTDRRLTGRVLGSYARQVFLHSSRPVLVHCGCATARSMPTGPRRDPPDGNDRRAKAMKIHRRTATDVCSRRREGGGRPAASCLFDHHAASRSDQTLPHPSGALLGGGIEHRYMELSYPFRQWK